jgi:hypothetical protein
MKISNQHVPSNFEPIICSKCAAEKTPDEIIKAVVAEAQKQTGLTEIAAVTFYSIDTLGNVTGVEQKLGETPKIPE